MQDSAEIRAPDATVRADGTVLSPFPAPPGPFPEVAPRSPRARLLAVWCASLVQAADSGDIAAARVAHEAIGRLLAAPANEGEGAEVVSIAERRS